MEFFGTLSKEWALECMKDLLIVNLRGNLQIIVQVFFVIYIVFSVTDDAEIPEKYLLCRLPKNILSNWVSIHALSSLSSSNPTKVYTSFWDRI